MQLPSQGQDLLPTDAVSCSELVHKSLLKIYKELMNAVNNAPTEEKNNRSYLIMLSTSERCRLLLVELIALLKWTKNTGILCRCNELVRFSNDNGNILKEIESILEKLEVFVLMCFQPIFPLNSALSVLDSGSYPFFPAICNSRSMYLSRLSMDDGKMLIRRILRTRIATEDIPSFVTNIAVENVEIVCSEENFFSVYVTSIVTTLVFVHCSAPSWILP